MLGLSSRITCSLLNQLLTIYVTGPGKKTTFDHVIATEKTSFQVSDPKAPHIGLQLLGIQS